MRADDQQIDMLLADDPFRFFPYIALTDEELMRYAIQGVKRMFGIEQKYFDFNVVQGQEFVFIENGRPIGSPAHSLKELAALPQGYGSSVGEHARRGDSSRWIANVFYDLHLASDIRKIEQWYRLGYLRDVRQPIAALILARYAASAKRVVLIFERRRLFTLDTEQPARRVFDTTVS